MGVGVGDLFALILLPLKVYFFSVGVGVGVGDLFALILILLTAVYSNMNNENRIITVYK